MKTHHLIIIQDDCNIENEIHKRVLEIASCNLDELNQRFNNSKEIIYNHDRSEFSLSDSYDIKNRDVVDFLNWFIDWDVQVGEQRSSELKTFIEKIHSQFTNLRSILNMTKITSTLTSSDKETVKNFVNKYRDFKPQCFLSFEEEQIIQNTLNSYCDELEDRFL